MYTIEIQYLPNVDSMWVQRLKIEDPIYSFETLEEAELAKSELEKKDTSGRKYRTKEVFD